MSLAGRLWLPLHDKALQVCLDEGMSSNQAAAHLNYLFGTSFSRNAVIGRVSRAKMKRPEGTVKKPAPRPKAQIPRPQIVCRPIVRRPDPTIPLNISIYELTKDTCRWPLGGWPEVSPVTFCGCQSLEDKPYCLDHTALSLRKDT